MKFRFYVTEKEDRPGSWQEAYAEFTADDVKKIEEYLISHGLASQKGWTKVANAQTSENWDYFSTVISEASWLASQRGFPEFEDVSLIELDPSDYKVKTCYSS